MNAKKRELKRKLRVRKKVRGTKAVPRLSVFRSNTYMYAQIINDENQQTIIGVSEKQLPSSSSKLVEKAKQLGLLLAERAVKKGIKKVVFDRGGYTYHGTVKSLAEGAREGGLQF